MVTTATFISIQSLISQFASLSTVIREMNTLSGPSWRGAWLRLLRADGVAIRFIHQAHGFHQKTRRVARCGSARGSVGGVEIDFKFSFGPELDFRHCIVALDVADLGVPALPAGEIELAVFAAMLHPQSAGLLPHLERLHQVNHAHFFEPPLDNSRGGSKK